MSIIQDIADYLPFNEQEYKDKEVILAFIKSNPDVFYRTNLIAHLTASAWVLNQKHDKVIMVYHKIYRSWSWCGGHADGNEDLLSVAVRECKEETGLQNVTPLSDKIFSLEILTVDGHEKHGSYVPSHLHLNVTYLLEADERDKLRICEAENTGVSWFVPEEALRASTEPWFVERIYSKLVFKTERFFAANEK